MSEPVAPHSQEALGAVIRRHRNQVGLSQEELGRRAQYQAGAGVAISRIESGQTAVTPARLTQLAEALGVSVDQLTSEAGAATNAGSTPERGALSTAVQRGTLRERRAEVERRVKQRQEVLDRLVAAVAEALKRAESGFVLPFIAMAQDIDGAPQAEMPTEVDVDTMTPDWYRRHGVELARFDVSELLRVVRPLQQVGAPIGHGAQLATLKLVTRFGTASTGRAIRALHGVAQESAALARIGLGSKASGGFGIRGGNLVLTAVGVAPAVLLAVGGGAAVYQGAKQQAVRDAETGLDATQDRFDALTRVLERSAAVLDEIGVFATRRLEKWERDLPESTPVGWDDLSTDQQQSYDDFVTLVTCFLSVASLDPDRLVEEDAALADVVAEFDAALDESSGKAADLL